VVPVAGPDDAAGFRFNSDFTPIAGTRRPWIYASGLTGEITLKVLGVESRNEQHPCGNDSVSFFGL